MNASASLRERYLMSIYDIYRYPEDIPFGCLRQSWEIGKLNALTLPISLPKVLRRSLLRRFHCVNSLVLTSISIRIILSPIAEHEEDPNTPFKAASPRK